MPAERAGYTVTMFVVDVARTMGTTRTIELPPGPNGEERTTEITNLQWALQFVKLKVQEMIYNGRKTDKCGVIVFGSEETKNIVNTKHDGYENVLEYIPIDQPNAATLTKLDALQPSTITGDSMDALIVAIETQADHLEKKKTWTRKIVLITDGENPIEVEEWEQTADKMNALGVNLVVVGIDFDDEEYGFEEEGKSQIKSANETFYKELIGRLTSGFMGTCAFAMEEIAKPDMKQTKSTLSAQVLRLGDVDSRPEESIELVIKTSKCTAQARAKSWKKYGMRVDKDKKKSDEEEMEVDDDDEDDDDDAPNARKKPSKKIIYAPLKMRTEYFIDRNGPEHGEEDKPLAAPKDEDDDEEGGSGARSGEIDYSALEKVEKEELVKGFKYGTSYAPCEDGQFERLPTKKGIEICGFFPTANYPRHLAMGEIQYVWGDPSSPNSQVGLSSIAQAMDKWQGKGSETPGVYAIARWVTRDGMDPKIGVLRPELFEGVHCLIWAQMPFADDVRRYTFPSLDTLISKKGEEITEHPYIPTDEQQEAMDDFVDAMDLMEAGDKDEEGNRTPWFNTLEAYNPAVHRAKQAMFHCAVVNDLDTNPVPPPHPELLKYLEPPKRVVKGSKEAVERCKKALDVREVPKKVAKTRKDHAHVHDNEDDEELLLLPKRPAKMDVDPDPAQATQSQSPRKSQTQKNGSGEDSGTEDDEEEDDYELLKKQKRAEEAKKRAANGADVSMDVDDDAPETTGAPDDDVDMNGGDEDLDVMEPGRIISSTNPLRDFQKNLEEGDVVTKAVEDMCAVILEIVVKPFASRRHEEIIECMKVLRDTVLKEDEIDAWNAFLPELKTKCLESTPGNKEFWSELQNIGRDISLISNKEAKKHGGTAKVSEDKAGKFLST